MGRGCGAFSMPPRIASSRRPSQPLRRREWRSMTKGSENGACASKEDINGETGTMMPLMKGLPTEISLLAAGPRRMQGARARLVAPRPPRWALSQFVGLRPIARISRRGTNSSDISFGGVDPWRTEVVATKYHRRWRLRGG